MKIKKYSNISDLAKGLGMTKEDGILSEMKAQLTFEIIKAVEKQNLTHQQVADLSGVPRSSITGIINGSLQKVTLDRLVRIINVLGKKVELKIKKAA